MPSSSSCCRAHRIRTVSLLPQRAPGDATVCGGHWERAGDLQQLQPTGPALLPQRLPFPVLGAVCQSAPLAPPLHQCRACLHLSGVCPFSTQPVDRWHHSKYCKQRYVIMILVVDGSLNRIYSRNVDLVHFYVSTRGGMFVCGLLGAKFCPSTRLVCTATPERSYWLQSKLT